MTAGPARGSVKMTVSRVADTVLLALVCGYAAWALALGNAYTLRVLSVAGIYAILAMGYQFVFGHAGALSLAQGTFMGVGAYASGILALRAGLPFDAALPLSVGVPVALAALAAMPVLHLQTHYFALATLIIGQVAFLAVTEWVSLTGGANGLGGVPPLELLGARIPSGWPQLAVCWGLVGLSALLAWRITSGRLALAWAMMRMHPDAADAIGVDRPRLRMLAFLLAAGYAGLAGSLHVHLVRVVSPDALAFPVMVVCLLIVVMGGRIRIAGAVLGAVLITQLPEWFRPLRDAYLLAYGVLLLGAIVVAPAGLAGAVDALVRRLASPGLRDAAPALPHPAPMPAPPAIAAAGPLLRLDGLTKRYGGVLALDGVSLDLQAGEVLGLIGPNGSGKTTLINAVTGFATPDKGRMLLDGRDLAGMPTYLLARAGIARTFQTAALPDGVLVVDAVAVARSPGRLGLWHALRAARADLEQARAEALGLLDRLGLADLAGRPCGAIPHAARRQVEIARALALQPRVLLLDEPAAGLDGAGQAALARRLRGLADQGLAILVVEHSLPFLALFADRAICLDAGRVIAAGPLDAVRSDPRVVRAYLGTGASAPA